MHYAVQWWFSRSERVLLVFWIQCAMHAAVCAAMVAFFLARTIPDTQAALDRLVTIGLLNAAVVLHFYACLADRRDRAYRAFVTGVLFFLAVLNQWAPLRGTVLALETIQLTGGVTRSFPIRTPPGASLALVYLALLAVHGYGLFIARVFWKHDRAGASLVAVGSAAVLVGTGVGFLIDFAKLRAPYVGPIPHAIYVACIALYLSRGYATRGTQLAASEQSLARALRKAQEALANLQAEQRRREEAEGARQKALEAMVQAQRTGLASQLAAGAAHDFGSVLSVISIWSREMLSDSGSAIDKERIRRGFSDAQQQGQAISRRLMDLTRPEARSVARFRLDRPIQATVQTLTPALPRTIRLGFEASVAPEVEADETEIRQVIYNLVLNARDAMPNGGSIRLIAGVETLPNPIDVVGGALAAGRWATLSVIDSGPGIDPAIRDRIFDLFFTTKGDRGTGLGLATVLRIAKANGGGVSFETETGRGTAFKMYLPCVDPPPDRSSSSWPPDADLDRDSDAGPPQPAPSVSLQPPESKP
jgi:signal transduction histidine kinase